MFVLCSKVDQNVILKYFAFMITIFMLLHIYCMSWTFSNFGMHVLYIRNLAAGEAILTLLFIKETKTLESVFKFMKCTLLKGKLYLMFL